MTFKRATEYGLGLGWIALLLGLSGGSWWGLIHLAACGWRLVCSSTS